MYSTNEIINMIAEGNIEKFYNNRAWRKLSREVLEEQHNECYICKAKGIYRRATRVHHAKELKKFPQYAYDRYYIDSKGNKHINLIALCYNCHEDQHPDRMKKFQKKKKQLNTEQW